MGNLCSADEGKPPYGVNAPAAKEPTEEELAAAEKSEREEQQRLSLSMQDQEQKDRVEEHGDALRSPTHGEVMAAKLQEDAKAKEPQKKPSIFERMLSFGSKPAAKEEDEAAAPGSAAEDATSPAETTAKEAEAVKGEENEDDPPALENAPKKPSLLESLGSFMSGTSKNEADTAPAAKEPTEEELAAAEKSEREEQQRLSLSMQDQEQKDRVEEHGDALRSPTHGEVMAAKLQEDAKAKEPQKKPSMFERMLSFGSKPAAKEEDKAAAPESAAEDAATTEEELAAAEKSEREEQQRLSLSMQDQEQKDRVEEHGDALRSPTHGEVMAAKLQEDAKAKEPQKKPSMFERMLSFGSKPAAKEEDTAAAVAESDAQPGSETSVEAGDETGAGANAASGGALAVEEGAKHAPASTESDTPVAKAVAAE